MDPKDASFGDLLPEERPSVIQAADRRVREFAAGRSLSRRLIRRRLPGFAGPIRQGAAGEPVWPRGVLGSISHTTGRVVAAVASSREYLGVGIDVEPAAPLPDGVLRIVASAREVLQLSRSGIRVADRVLFSAKESIFKAQYSFAGAPLDFEDVDVVVDDEGTFAGSLVSAVGDLRVGHQFAGRWHIAEGFIMSAVVVPVRTCRASTNRAGFAGVQPLRGCPMAGPRSIS